MAWIAPPKYASTLVPQRLRHGIINPDRGFFRQSAGCRKHAKCNGRLAGLPATGSRANTHLVDPAINPTVQNLQPHSKPYTLLARPSTTC